MKARVTERSSLANMEVSHGNGEVEQEEILMEQENGEVEQEEGQADDTSKEGSEG